MCSRGGTRGGDSVSRNLTKVSRCKQVKFFKDAIEHPTAELNGNRPCPPALPDFKVILAMDSALLERPALSGMIPKIMVCVAAALLVVAVYVVATKSADMKTYRWFLLNYMVITF